MGESLTWGAHDWISQGARGTIESGIQATKVAIDYAVQAPREKGFRDGDKQLLHCTVGNLEL